MTDQERPKYTVVQDNGYTVKLRNNETGHTFYYHPSQGGLGDLLSQKTSKGGRR